MSEQQNKNSAAGGQSGLSGLVRCQSNSFKEWWQEHGSIDYDEMCKANEAWDAALNQVMPKLYEILRGEIIVGSVVNFETVKQAVKLLKALNDAAQPQAKAAHEGRIE